jgi:hypothetical protein
MAPGAFTEHRGMWMRQAVGVVVVTVIVGALAGCTGSTPEAPSPTVSATVSATPFPTPTPTPTSDVNDESDTALGIVFGDAPPLEGDAAQVYNWVSVFEKEYWRTLTTNQVSPAFDLIGSPEVQTQMENVANKNAASNLDIGGTFHVVISDVVVDPAAGTATASACTDLTQATFSDPNGSYTAAQVGVPEPIRNELRLQQVLGDQWRIATSNETGTC